MDYYQICPQHESRNAHTITWTPTMGFTMKKCKIYAIFPRKWLCDTPISFTYTQFAWLCTICVCHHSRCLRRRRRRHRRRRQLEVLTKPFIIIMRYCSIKCKSLAECFFSHSTERVLSLALHCWNASFEPFSVCCSENMCNLMRCVMETPCRASVINRGPTRCVVSFFIFLRVRMWPLVSRCTGFDTRRSPKMSRQTS